MDKKKNTVIIENLVFDINVKHKELDNKTVFVDIQYHDCRVTESMAKVIEEVFYVFQSIFLRSLPATKKVGSLWE